MNKKMPLEGANLQITLLTGNQMIVVLSPSLTTSNAYIVLLQRSASKRDHLPKSIGNVLTTV